MSLLLSSVSSVYQDIGLVQIAIILVIIILIVGLIYVYRSLNTRIDQGTFNPQVISDVKDELTNLNNVSKESIMKLNQKVDTFITYSLTKMNVRPQQLEHVDQHTDQHVQNTQNTQHAHEQHVQQESQDPDQQDDIVFSDIRLN